MNFEIPNISQQMNAEKKNMILTYLYYFYQMSTNH